MKIILALLLCSLGFIDASEKPNFIIIFADDQGYGDLGCFGSTQIKTPHIDRLAKEGRKFTNFMVASPVCTPSRAALLTGCYPKRVGLHQHVLFPSSTKGLNPTEHTIADHLKSQGYATACFGKWHLGHHPETLPQQNGFDTYFGIPYSNDMNHPLNGGKPQGGPEGMDILWNDASSTLTKWNTPLMENDRIIELPVDQRTVTRRYTDRAIEFIKKCAGTTSPSSSKKAQPFFLYLPHSMPHIPLYVPDDFRDPNPLKAYTNVIEHIDSEVGRITNLLRELQLTKNTYLIYTSDNGPWLKFKHHAGSAGPLRSGKGTTFEGGQRVPCVMWAPGHIPANTTCDQLCSTIDLLPTIASLTRTPLPPQQKIDGLNISDLLTQSTPSPRKEYLYYTSKGDIEGIRQGKYKLLIKYPRRKKNEPRKLSATPEVLLFDLLKDLGEQHSLVEKHPDLVAKLKARMLELDAEVTNNARAPWVKKKE